MIVFRTDDGIAIAPFAGVIDLDRHAGETLDHELAGLSGVPTGAAGDDVDLFCGAEFGLADLHFVEEDVAGIERNASQGGVADGARLLVNFLEHEVLEAALFRHDRVPGHVLYLALDRLSVEIRQLHAGGSDNGEVAIGEKENVARVIKNGGNVGGDKVFVVAQADHQRRTVARGDDFVRLVDGDDRQSKDSAEFFHGPANRLLESGLVAVASFEKMLFDQMSDDFGIGFGRELVAFLDQLFLEAEIVFDDAVVYDHDLAGAVAMRMSVFFRGTSVSGPAGVANAVGAVERLEADGFFQIAQLAFGAPELQLVPVAGDGNSR